MTTRPTSAQLKKLAVKTDKPTEVPQAPPEVAAKARELLKNPSGSTVESGTVICTDEDRIAFLAHILKGVPFLKSYELFGNKVLVEFTTLGISTVEAIYRFACIEETTNPAAKPENRYGRLQAYKAATSIKKLRVDGHIISGIGDVAWDSDKFYLIFAKTVTPDLLTAIEAAYTKYEGLISFLISKADDKSFY